MIRLFLFFIIAHHHHYKKTVVVDYAVENHYREPRIEIDSQTILNLWMNEEELS